MILPRQITTDLCQLRPWKADEQRQLSQRADDPSIAKNLWDRFPSPYTLGDAAEWLNDHADKPPLDGAYAIDVGGEPMGTIAVHPRADVERLSGEIGYWLAQECWGRGIATAAVTAVTEAVFQHTSLLRIYAPVFSWNPASMRVLEKSGYVAEGILRQSIVKHGTLLDRVLYARTRAGELPYQPYSRASKRAAQSD